MLAKDDFLCSNNVQLELCGNKKKESTATIPDEIANLLMWSDSDSDDASAISHTSV